MDGLLGGLLRGGWLSGLGGRVVVGAWETYAKVSMTVTSVAAFVAFGLGVMTTSDAGLVMGLPLMNGEMNGGEIVVSAPQSL